MHTMRPWTTCAAMRQKRAVRAHLRSHLRGAASGRLAHQAPVSYRILPQVLGQAQRAGQAVAHAATTALGSVTQNPRRPPPPPHPPPRPPPPPAGFPNGPAPPPTTRRPPPLPD